MTDSHPPINTSSNTSGWNVDSTDAFHNNNSRQDWGSSSTASSSTKQSDSSEHRKNSTDENFFQYRRTGSAGRARDLTLNTNVQDDANHESQPSGPGKDSPVSWRSLPRKDQLLVLVLARLSEPLTQNSLGSYIYYQLRSFDPDLPDSTISYQAGVIHAAFPAAQCVTAILWGRFADSEYGGRKRVIWIGLLGTMFSMIGFGFSHNFRMAVLFRCLGGVLNGNIGVMRTLISEIIKEKKYQSRAFSILPMTFNIGVIVGPILGGILADPVASYPALFGPNSLLGGKSGVQWMIRWPYALPNLVSAVFLFISACGIIFFLEETHQLLRHNPDPGLRVGRWIRKYLCRRRINDGYTQLPAHPHDVELQDTPVTPSFPETHMGTPPSRVRKLPFRRIWTRNLITTLLAHGLLAMHVGTFNSLWYIYLSAPRYDPTKPNPPKFKPHGFFHFTGGLALPPPRIGLAGAILGLMGITLQLFLYPRLSHRLGTIRCYRLFLMFFPITYTLAPFLSRIPSTTPPPEGVSGLLIWICITVVLLIQVFARTFALPCMIILINNCSPHPSVLGTVHGIGQTVSSLTRTIGPIIFAWTFGRSLDIGIVGISWWILALVAVLGSIAGRFLYEGDGHEILLEEEVKNDGTVERRD
ncbi:MFS general substrate transporter [Westerdykella ornata]|uniref:MFS general substrate transporter n=1 Tax=Westerdykella ornata TaxID=318751 RepID=A0A6A6JG46_WESOR|nr:MFS general substrate transporter [Westerdykella ornata]KAF2275307.1 MFS general substrate transporter [Westerdykella ornata]